VTVAGLVLAAGAGRRYGMPKALVEYEGSLLVERAVRTARAVCDPVLVVLGAQATDVRDRADLTGATVLVNADWATGMASSLRTGLEGLRGWPGAAGRRERAIVAALVLLVDMPGMTPAALQRMAGQAGPDALAVAAYDGVRGHPVLLGREHWAGVARTATGDEGARRYLAAHSVTEVDCTGLADPADLDVPPAPPA
jgi:molybdenum cofactor cytidylyltransferase/nicotine blue oxidoreductase